jgi:hypothetical protein
MDDRLTTKLDSPSRGEGSRQQLQPCLVQHNATAYPGVTPTRLRVVRDISPPSRHYDHLVTVPLRPCCADCEAIWEQSRREGEEWKEKFTRGARRKRNSSIDSPAVLLTKQQHMKTGMEDANVEFTSVLAIKVDEIDKKRGSSESQSSNSDRGVPVDSNPVNGRLMIDTAYSATPIQEEDEDQLFPLPSPRRSPNASPIPSPSASSSCLALTGVNDTRLGRDVGVPKKPSLQSLRLPSRVASPSSSSPTIPSPLRPGSYSAPLPSRNITLSPLTIDPGIANAEPILSSPISRLSRSSSMTSSRSTKGRTSFAKTGSGLLKGVFMSLGSPPLV